MCDCCFAVLMLRDNLCYYHLFKMVLYDERESICLLTCSAVVALYLCILFVHLYLSVCSSIFSFDVLSVGWDKFNVQFNFIFIISCYENLSSIVYVRIQH
jgi:hypothetical protein